MPSRKSRNEIAVYLKSRSLRQIAKLGMTTGILLSKVMNFSYSCCFNFTLFSEVKQYRNYQQFLHLPIFAYICVCSVRFPKGGVCANSAIPTPCRGF